MTDLIGMNNDKVVALFFINPHVIQSKSKQQASFWDSVLGVIDSIKGIFVSSEMASSDIEELIAKNSILVEIDVSDPKLASVEAEYDITTVPFLIVQQNKSILYKGVPTTESYKTIIGIINKSPNQIQTIEKVRDVLN